MKRFRVLTVAVLLIVVVTALVGCAAPAPSAAPTTAPAATAAPAQPTAAPTVAVELPAGRPTPVAAKPAKPLRIAMIAFQNNPFWFPVRDGVKKANEVLEPMGAKVDWIVAGDSLDVPTVNAAIKAAVADGYDAIGVVPLADGACPAIKQAADAGRLVATFIAEGKCSKDNGAIFFHGQDLYGAGKQMGEILKQIQGDKAGKVGVITGAFTVEAHELRRKGFLDAIKGSNLTPVNEGVENQDQADKAASIARDFMASTPDLAAIYVTAGGPFGAAEEVAKAGKSDQVKVIGFDFTDEAVKAVREGKMYATIGQDPFGEGYETAIMLYNALVTGQKPAEYFLPVKADVMTKDNVDAILATQK